MSNENKSIHEFDFSLICEYFSSVERQGPGSAETTIKALSFVEGLTDKSLIADLGCGTGGQTITLGKSSVRCPLKPGDSIPLCQNNPTP